MWPPAVEAVAEVFRTAGVEARLEELAPDEDGLPGTAVEVTAFVSDGRRIVALLPAGERVDRAKLSRSDMHPTAPPPFPYRGCAVYVDARVLAERRVWLRADSPRHAVGLAPSQLARLLRAETRDLAVAET